MDGFYDLHKGLEKISDKKYVIFLSIYVTAKVVEEFKSIINSLFPWPRCFEQKDVKTASKDVQSRGGGCEAHRRAYKREGLIYYLPSGIEMSFTRLFSIKILSMRSRATKCALFQD